MDKEKLSGVNPEEKGDGEMTIVSVSRNGDVKSEDASDNSSSSAEEVVDDSSEEKIEMFESMEADEENTIKVRIGNFICIKDLDKHHPYITVFPISRSFYVGYSIDMEAYALLNSVLFDTEGEPSDEDLQSVFMFLVGVMASATAIDAEFTNKTILYFNGKKED